MAKREMQAALVGQRVILCTLLMEGDFPGEIVYVDPVFGTCVVKLERQVKPVNGVLYYERRPRGEIPASHWQFCFPDRD